MLNSDPDWDPALFEGTRRLYYGRWTYKYESAARHGAAGAIIVHTTPSAGYPWQVVQSSWSGPQFELPAGGAPTIQIAAWATEEAARRLTAAGGRNLDALVTAARSRDFKPVPLGIRTSFTLANTLSKVQTANVAGLLRGSDPRLSGEAVVFTAHFDHLGMGAADATGDRIYNGRSWCCSSQRRNRGCWGPSTTRGHRPLLRGASRPTSTTTAATSGAGRATSPCSASESRRSIGWRWRP
jgi:Zn-dependent M28 family amino/carboxypeptidase